MIRLWRARKFRFMLASQHGQPFLPPLGVAMQFISRLQDPLVYCGSSAGPAITFVQVLNDGIRVSPVFGHGAVQLLCRKCDDLLSLPEAARPFAPAFASVFCMRRVIVVLMRAFSGARLNAASWGAKLGRHCLKPIQFPLRHS